MNASQALFSQAGELEARGTRDEHASATTFAARERRLGKRQTLLTVEVKPDYHPLLRRIFQSCFSLLAARMRKKRERFKALAKRRRKLTQVEDLGQIATLFGQGLRALALTCDDLRSLWSRSNLQAKGRKFFTVWPPNPSQLKLSNVH